MTVDVILRKPKVMVGFCGEPGNLAALVGKSTPSEVTLGRSSDGDKFATSIYIFKM